MSIKCNVWNFSLLINETPVAAVFMKTLMHLNYVILAVLSMQKEEKGQNWLEKVGEKEPKEEIKVLK